MPHVVKPDQLAVRRVQKRDAELTLVARLRADAPRVAFGLGENPLRGEAQPLGLNHGDGLRVEKERVVGRPALRLELLDPEGAGVRAST